MCCAILLPNFRLAYLSPGAKMAESVGNCEANSYLLNLFNQQTLYPYFLVILVETRPSLHQYIFKVFGIYTDKVDIEMTR